MAESAPVEAPGGLEREIHEQPAALQRLLASDDAARAAAAIRAAAPRCIVIAARGTSDNAARYAQYVFGIHARLPVALAAPSIHTLYGAPPRYTDCVVIGISQSGQSPDVAQVVIDATAQGALTIALTNDAQSPLARAAAHHIALQAGPERSVAATKTYTAELVALAQMAATLADASAQPAMRADLARLPEQVRAALDLAPQIAVRAERFRFLQRCVVLGRGYNYATAHEIALKLKELTYIVAEPYSSADFRHGPKAMVEQGFAVIALAPEGAAQADMLALLADLRGQGADLTVIGAAGAALDGAHLPLALPPGVPEWLSPVVAVVPGQLLAMGIAAAKGHPVEKPRGLTKVTQTR